MLEMEIVVRGEDNDQLHIFCLMSALRNGWAITGKGLFGFEFGLTFVFVEQTTFIFIQNGAAGFPGGLISVQNELLVHLYGCQKDGVLQAITKIR